MTQITRRNFIKLGAAGTATAVLAGCAQEGEEWVTLEPYVRAPEEQLPGLSSLYATTCRMCPAGCGILAEVTNGRAVKLEGNPEHPVSRGKTCARGQAGLQLLYNPDRVTGAVRQSERGSRKFEAIPWSEAINELKAALSGIGAGLAVWTGSTTSAHLADLFARLTEALGAPAPLRYDLYSGLNGYDVLAAANAAFFDRAGLPVYHVGRADVVFSFGADFLGTWLNATAYNVEYGEFRSQPFGERGYLVQFEPKMTSTGAKADRWIPARPGSEALIAQALIRLIADEDGLAPADRAERARALAGEVDLEQAAAAAGLPVEGLAELARLFAQGERPLALPGPVLTGRSDALAATMAVQALNVIAGTFGQPGGMDVISEAPVSALVAPRSSTYADARALIERMKAGEVKVLLVHNANPAYELPREAGFVDALENVELIVSFNPLVDETSVHADYILPDRVYLEGWGYDVPTPTSTGSPVISSQQPVVPPLYDIRATADVLLAVAQGISRAGQAMPWQNEVEYLREVITQLPTGATGSGDEATRWARFQQAGGWWPAVPVANAAPEPNQSQGIDVPAMTYQGSEEEYPYHLHLYFSVLLNDGSGAAMPWLQGSPDPMTTVSWQTWVEINPQTADELDVNFNDIVKIESPFGEIEALVYVFPAIRPDTVAVPLGQGHSDYGRYARQRGANALRLLGPEADQGGSLIWSNVRVKIRKTGEKKDMARLESTIAVSEDDHLPF